MKRPLKKKLIQASVSLALIVLLLQFIDVSSVFTLASPACGGGEDRAPCACGVFGVGAHLSVIRGCPTSEPGTAWS